MSAPLKRLSRWQRLPLYLLPAHVREEHAREMAEMIADGRDGLSGSGVILDAIRAAPAAHWDVLRQDLRAAAAQMRRAPGFTAVAALTLAVGIGTNAALFALVDATLFQPLPYRSADRLVTIDEENIARGMTEFGSSPANLTDLTRALPALEAVGASWTRVGTAQVADTPERVVFTAVSAGFFAVFQDPPIAGRVLREEDDVPGSSAAVISQGFWVAAFGGSPDVIGRSFTLDGRTRNVVGVMPAEFAWPGGAVRAWVPLALSAEDQARRGARYLGVVGRLPPGVDREALQTALDGRMATLAEQHPEQNAGWTVRARDLRDAMVGSLRTPLMLVWAAAGLVLLIAVANVANLLLGRSVAREREMALRSAVGARCGRLTRQLLTEGLLLAGLGGVLGLFMAQGLLELLSQFDLAEVAGVTVPAVSARVMLFAGGLVVLTTLLASLLPIRASGTGRLWAVLAGTRGSGGRDRTRWQSGLVVAEVALAVLVLVASGLVVRSLAGLLGEPLGLHPDGVVTFRIEPPFHVNGQQPMDQVLAELADDRSRADEGFRVLTERLQGFPGVTAVGGINRLPFTGEYWVTGVDIAGRGAERESERLAVYVRPVTPGYFEAIGTRILSGRAFTLEDRAGAERVAVIDAEFARQYWGTEDPLGAHLLLDGPPDEPQAMARVVGVAEAVVMNRLDEARRPAFYLPFAQATEGHGSSWGMDIVLRSAPVEAVAPAVRQAVREAFPDASINQLSSMQAIVDASLADRRFQLLVLGVFALTSLVLTMVGVAGVLSLVVRQRSRELGIRLALGARPSRLWWQVQGRGIRLVGSGALIGIVAAFGGATLFASLVYGVSVRDPLAFAAGPAVLCLAALAAAAIPAARAMRVDPVTVLREE